ncbi:membrane protein [Actinoplanes philippinensis]|uniref:Putative Holin-X, holin superfamily III n=1 Tax=Actinoplanes philippinensis TaxID=35752 RepID=A0A1I2F7L4_9ACTN|nr:phage holin family protein [Actinoplanes philippinensis]GIE77491.1 membrane protein [Actinoplanes philippinensis]SFF00616.1 Putative Holin-X, holin superfamily III [Actinoplanes philippinensis]
MADVVNGVPVRPTAEKSTAELVQMASEQLSRLVRDEITLAKAELAEKGKRAGIGAGLFGGAGALAMYGLGAAIATGIIALDLVLPLWLAALIVTVVLFVTAGVLALLGKNQISRAVPPEPLAAIESVKADVDEVKHAVKERSRA